MRSVGGFIGPWADMEPTFTPAMEVVIAVEELSPAAKAGFVEYLYGTVENRAPLRSV